MEAWQYQKLVRQVNCQLASLANKLDKIFCRDLALCEKGTKLTYEDEHETVIYSA
jgi:hypothetical protein